MKLPYTCIFSYGHLDIAALLIEHGAAVNAPDRWGFTPLHESSQKVRQTFAHLCDMCVFQGRTQLCSLLLNHGADPSLRNQEGHTALDLATSDDVRSLIQDSMPSMSRLDNVFVTSTPDLTHTTIYSPTASVSTVRILTDQPHSLDDDDHGRPSTSGKVLIVIDYSI
jgi:tankyrase